MKKRNFLIQMYLRIKADTPSFFKKIAQFGVGLGLFMGAVILLPNTPKRIKSVADRVVWCAGVMTLLPLLVVKDKYEADDIIYKK